MYSKAHAFSPGLVLTLLGINTIDPVLRDITADFSTKLFCLVPGSWCRARNFKITSETSQRNRFDTVIAVIIRLHNGRHV